jgi:hypothetical protein
MNKRLAFFITSLLLLSCIILFITCKKEYSYEGGSPPPPPPGPVGDASFTLVGSPNNCQSVVVKGRYISGDVISSNSADINVNVTAIGNYTLTTDTIDGIWFSTSGTFTNTGNQTITLTGNGTPEFARNILFTLLTASSSCTFKITVTNPGPLAVYVLESGFGNPNPCKYTLSGTYTSNTPLSGSNTVSIRVYVTYLGNFTIATAAVNGMMFSYSGSFTTLGAQDVILYGVGTPLNRGTYTLTPEIVGPHPIGGEFCSFFISVN